MPLHIRSRPLLDSLLPIRVKREVSISESPKIERHLGKCIIYYNVEVLTEGALVDSPNSISVSVEGAWVEKPGYNV